MRTLLIITMVVVLMLMAPGARADMVCPKGSLNDLSGIGVWEQYARTSERYITELLRKMAVNMARVVEARSSDEEIRSAAVITRMSNPK